jgi:hypothetical protein
MVEAVGVDFSGEDVGPMPFSAMHPLPMGHPLTGIISAPGPPSAVEWEWMAAALIGTPNAPVLVFGPPSMVASAPVPLVGWLAMGRGGARGVPRGMAGALLTCHCPDMIGKGHFHPPPLSPRHC